MHARPTNNTLYDASRLEGAFRNTKLIYRFNKGQSACEGRLTFYNLYTYVLIIQKLLDNKLYNDYIRVGTKKE